MTDGIKDIHMRLLEQLTESAYSCYAHDGSYTSGLGYMHMIKFPSNLKECEGFSCSECDAKGTSFCWYPGKELFSRTKPITTKRSPSYEITVIDPEKYGGFQAKTRFLWVDGIKPDFSNIIIHSKNGDVLTHWIENYADSRWADIWIVLPANDDYITFCWIIEEPEKT